MSVDPYNQTGLVKTLHHVLRAVLTDIFHTAFMFKGGQSPDSIFSPICIQIAEDIFIIRASDAALRFLNILDIVENP